MKAGSFSGIHDLNKEPVERLCRFNLPQSVHGKKSNPACCSCENLNSEEDNICLTFGLH